MFSLMIGDVCNPHGNTSGKTEWLRNNMHQGLYDKAKNIIKQDACMKFYDAP